MNVIIGVLHLKRFAVSLSQTTVAVQKAWPGRLQDLTVRLQHSERSADAAERTATAHERQLELGERLRPRCKSSIAGIDQRTGVLPIATINAATPPTAMIEPITPRNAPVSVNPTTAMAPPATSRMTPSTTRVVSER